MDKTKKCYHCSAEAGEKAKACPKCNAKLGARTEFGMAGKPGSPLLKILFTVFLLALVGKLAGYSFLSSPAASGNSVEILKGANKADDAKSLLIRDMKSKGAGELKAVGVEDISYNNDALRVYVDSRFNNLSRFQQEKLVKIFANEWAKLLKKESIAVEIMEYGTDKKIDEWVLK